MHGFGDNTQLAAPKLNRIRDSEYHKQSLALGARIGRGRASAGGGSDEPDILCVLNHAPQGLI
jgi:hypothetical protein